MSTEPGARVPGHYDARFAGWHMVVRASRLRDAQRIANQAVSSFGGIVGVDVPRVSPATPGDLDEYRAMGGDV